MTKQLNDFETKQTNNSFYDMREDWALIEASFAKQYNIRLRHESMPWIEFCTLLGGLMPDTPLGQIVSIRSETDSDTIKAFNPDQRRIHSEWQTRIANNKLKDPKTLDDQMSQLSAMLNNMFGKGGNVSE